MTTSSPDKSPRQENPRAPALLDDIRAARPVFWANPLLLPTVEALPNCDFSRQEADDAAARLERFRPFIAAAFPETAEAGGLIESPLREIPDMAGLLRERAPLPGRLFLKMDSHLPISGSIKARGGVYEVLKHAESLALSQGKLRLSDNYSLLATPAMRDFFSRYSIAVGSTGNLGLSIGIISAKLGFAVTVHMSADARQWKKDLLREKGATVVEYEADYSEAVREGRAQAAATPGCHFVDDEDSRDLFLGYSVAARRLKAQLGDLGIAASAASPLSVYLPCGVGGGPGGVALGLKQEFGDAVRCWFAEPVQAPAVLLGLVTGRNENASAADFGLHGRTIADGLAVGRPSALACRAMRHLLDGAFTVRDDTLYHLLLLLDQTEGIRLEPSALAGFSGLAKVATHEKQAGLPPAAIHIVWATGGGMVPEQEWLHYQQQAKNLPQQQKPVATR